jgi:site-specific recombinase XerD
MLLVLYGTGLRVSELIGLDRTDVDVAECLLKVPQSNFGKTRLRGRVKADTLQHNYRILCEQ